MSNSLRSATKDQRLASRWVPETYTGRKEIGDAVVHFTQSPGKGNGKFAALAYKGTAARPAWHHAFRSRESMDAFIADFAKSVESAAARKQERKAERQSVKASDFYKVGDIVVCSWGYDQTNVDFYKITKVTNSTVDIVAIGGKTVGVEGQSSMSGQVTADPETVDLTDRKNGTKRVGPGGQLKLSSYSWASKWDGRPKYVSWYA